MTFIENIAKKNRSLKVIRYCIPDMNIERNVAVGTKQFLFNRKRFDRNFGTGQMTRQRFFEPFKMEMTSK